MVDGTQTLSNSPSSTPQNKVDVFFEKITLDLPKEELRGPAALEKVKGYLHELNTKERQELRDRIKEGLNVPEAVKQLLKNSPEYASLIEESTKEREELKKSIDQNLAIEQTATPEKRRATPLVVAQPSEEAVQETQEGSQLNPANWSSGTWQKVGWGAVAATTVAILVSIFRKTKHGAEVAKEKTVAGAKWVRNTVLATGGLALAGALAYFGMPKLKQMITDKLKNDFNTKVAEMTSKLKEVQEEFEEVTEKIKTATGDAKEKLIKRRDELLQENDKIRAELPDEDDEEIEDLDKETKDTLERVRESTSNMVTIASAAGLIFMHRAEVKQAGLDQEIDKEKVADMMLRSDIQKMPLKKIMGIQSAEDAKKLVSPEYPLTDSQAKALYFLGLVFTKRMKEAQVRKMLEKSKGDAASVEDMALDDALRSTGQSARMIMRLNKNLGGLNLSKLSETDLDKVLNETFDSDESLSELMHDQMSQSAIVSLEPRLKEEGMMAEFVGFCFQPDMHKRTIKDIIQELKSDEYKLNDDSEIVIASALEKMVAEVKTHKELLKKFTHGSPEAEVLIDKYLEGDLNLRDTLQLYSYLEMAKNQDGSMPTTPSGVHSDAALLLQLKTLNIVARTDRWEGIVLRQKLVVPTNISLPAETYEVLKTVGTFAAEESVNWAYQMGMMAYENITALHKSHPDLMKLLDGSALVGTTGAYAWWRLRDWPDVMHTRLDSKKTKGDKLGRSALKNKVITKIKTELSLVEAAFDSVGSDKMKKTLYAQWQKLHYNGTYSAGAFEKFLKSVDDLEKAGLPKATADLIRTKIADLRANPNNIKCLRIVRRNIILRGIHTTAEGAVGLSKYLTKIPGMIPAIAGAAGAKVVNAGRNVVRGAQAGKRMAKSATRSVVRSRPMRPVRSAKVRLSRGLRKIPLLRRAAKFGPLKWVFAAVVGKEVYDQFTVDEPQLKEEARTEQDPMRKEQAHREIIAGRVRLGSDALLFMGPYGMAGWVIVQGGDMARGSIEEGTDYMLQTVRELQQAPEGYQLWQISKSSPESKVTWGQSAASLGMGSTFDVANKNVREDAYTAYFKNIALDSVSLISAEELSEEVQGLIAKNNDTVPNAIQNLNEDQLTRFARYASEYIKYQTNNSSILCDEHILKDAEMYARIRTAEWREKDVQQGNMWKEQPEESARVSPESYKAKIEELSTNENSIIVEELKAVKTEQPSAFKEILQYSALGYLKHEIASCEQRVLSADYSNWGSWSAWTNMTGEEYMQKAARGVFVEKLVAILTSEKYTQPFNKATFDQMIADLRAVLNLDPDSLASEGISGERAEQLQKTGEQSGHLSVHGLMHLLKA